MTNGTRKLIVNRCLLFFATVSGKVHVVQLVPPNLAVPSCLLHVPSSTIHFRHCTWLKGTGLIPSSTRKKCVHVVERKFRDGIHKNLRMHVALDKSTRRPRMGALTWPMQLLRFLRPYHHFRAQVLVLRPLQTILGHLTGSSWSLNYSTFGQLPLSNK